MNKLLTIRQDKEFVDQVWSLDIVNGKTVWGTNKMNSFPGLDEALFVMNLKEGQTSEEVLTNYLDNMDVHNLVAERVRKRIAQELRHLFPSASFNVIVVFKVTIDASPIRCNH